MSIPGYQSFMLPFLSELKDHREHTLQELYQALAKKLELTQEDQQELLPSGKQITYKNRIGWARTYLIKAGLIERTGRGKFRITDQGLLVLEENLNEINNQYLKQFSSFRSFYSPGKDKSARNAEQVRSDFVEQDSRTPDELLEANYTTLRKNLAEEILETIKKCSPNFFESLVVDLLVAMGYGGSRVDAAQVIGRSGDEGVDGIIKEDKLGLDVLYIQAKRWGNTVGRPDVQAFAGSLEGKRARKGIFITTSRFAESAKEYVKSIEKKIVLINGEELAELMIDYNVGVSTQNIYTVKAIDFDYFNDE